MSSLTVPIRCSQDGMPEFGKAVIKVHVGKGCKREFIVHETLIRKSSAFFEAALGGNWPESDERLVKLPEQSAFYFDTYIKWLYSGHLYVVSKIGKWDEIDGYIRGYLLAEYIADQDYQDILIDCLLEWIQLDTMENVGELFMYLEDVEMNIFGDMEPDSPLQRLMVDVAAWYLDPSQWESTDLQRIFSRNFTRPVIIALSQRLQMGMTKTNPLLSASGTCHYHGHGNKPCYKTKRNICED